jgi:nucleotide-binding universal stress UspA family protein
MMGQEPQTIPEPHVFRRVLVGLDGSEESESTLPWVGLLAPRAEIILGMVVEPAWPAPSFSEPLSQAYIRDHGEDYLERVGGMISPPPRKEIRFGPLGEGLLGLARDRRCELIAVAARGGSRLRRRLLGGTTERLLHNSEFPILTVPASGREGGTLDLARIAMPLDGTPDSEVVLPIVAALALRHRALVYLIRAWQGNPKGSAERLDAVERRLQTQGVRVMGILGGGPGANELLGAVSETGSDLLVMGVHGHGVLRHLVSGGLPSQVIQRCPIPVMVLRHDATVIPGSS